ncbi:MAG TPA: YfjI family protein [Smithella sp.]|nr:YfjI family protein [Smithella sp.]
MNQLQTTSDLPNGWREDLGTYYQQQRSLNDGLKPLTDLLGDQLEQYWEPDEDAKMVLLSQDAEISCCRILADYFRGNAALVDAAYRHFGLFEPESWDEIYPNHDKTWGQKVIELVTSEYSLEREFFPEDSNKIECSASGGWPRPISLNDRSDLPIFPIDQIPDPCGSFGRFCSKHAQVDPGLVGNTILAVVSAALGGKVSIDLGTHEEPINIYSVASLESGNRKSTVMKECSDPINQYQIEQQQIMKDRITEAKSKFSILQKRLEALQKDAAKCNDPIERADIIKQCNDVIAEMNANPVPTNPTYLVDDITTEALGQLMADNNERGAVLSAEGGLFKNMAGLYNNGMSNIDLFLKAHAGDGWQSNRIGREAKFMANPALTLGLAVQPDVVEEICKNDEFRERGLKARFLYAICRSRAGYRSRHSDIIPPHLKMAYNKRILSLMQMNAHRTLTLTPDAQCIWDCFYDGIETELRPGGHLVELVDWGSKLPGAVARIAGLLHFANSSTSADLADGFREADKINVDTIWSAIWIGEYYMEHAKFVYNMMKTDSTLKVAHTILDYITRCKPLVFKGKDLFDHTNLHSMEKIQDGINILIKKNYIRLKSPTVEHRRIGRPPSPSYEINPHIFFPHG